MQKMSQAHSVVCYFFSLIRRTLVPGIIHFFPSYNIHEMVSKIIIQVLLLPPEFYFFLEYVCLVIDCDQESLGVSILFSVIL